MKKISLHPPEQWPPAGQRLYRDFEAQLASRLQEPRKPLLLLRPFFLRQTRQELSFLEFPQALLQAHLKDLTANRRRLFLWALTAWQRFLYARKELLHPLHTELPGGKVHLPRYGVGKLDIRPPEAWPTAAQRLYHDFAAQLSQRLRSAREYLRELYHFFPYQQQHGLDFRQFPVALIDDYLKPRSAPARRGFLTALVAWLRFLYARKELLLPLHEEMLERRPSVHGRRVLLSHQQVLQVLALPPLDEPEGLRDRAMLEMAYASGVRRGELVYLDLADVDLTTGLVSIRQTKNAYQRTVPLTHWGLHYLERYLQVARPHLTSPLSLNALWLSQRGRRLHKTSLGTRLMHVYKAEETLGFAFTLHQLRHACATHLLTSGAPLRDVQELLGHLNLNSTAIYTHLTPSRLRQVHHCCHPRNRPGNFSESGD